MEFAFHTHASLVISGQDVSGLANPCSGASLRMSCSNDIITGSAWEVRQKVGVTKKLPRRMLNRKLCTAWCHGGKWGKNLLRFSRFPFFHVRPWLFISSRNGSRVSTEDVKRCEALKIARPLVQAKPWRNDTRHHFEQIFGTFFVGTTLALISLISLISLTFKENFVVLFCWWFHVLWILVPHLMAFAWHLGKAGLGLGWTSPCTSTAATEWIEELTASTGIWATGGQNVSELGLKTTRQISDCIVVSVKC